jgi:transposase
MYIENVPNRNSAPAILLRESTREGKKTIKRTLANLSSWPVGKIEALKRILSGQEVGVSSEPPECGRIWAVMDVLNQVCNEIGLGGAIGNSKIAKFVKFLIFARLGHQGSRLSAVRWAKEHCVEEILGLKEFDENDLYGALDWIASRQDEVELKLYKNYLRINSEPPVLVLYDVTSSYFEGECNEHAEFGYNRDGKKGKKQIVIGLLTDVKGEALSVSVFKGNTGDPDTVETQIETLVNRFGITEVVFVGDRGMVKTEGKKLCAKANFKYISCLTDPQIRKIIKSNIIQPSLFDVDVCEVESSGKRLILKLDEQTKRKERHRREDKLNALMVLIRERNEFVVLSKNAQPEAGLKQLTSWVKKHKLRSFTSLSLENNQIQIAIDQSAKEQDELLDGCYVIETDVPKEMMSTQDAHDRYRDLQKVERDFRTMKTGLLEVRPIYLRNGERTQGHVFIAMLGLKLSRALEQRLSAHFGTTDANPHATTLEGAINTLSRFCLLKYTIGDQEVIGLPKPDARQKEVLDCLKIKLTIPKTKSPQTA